MVRKMARATTPMLQIGHRKNSRGFTLIEMMVVMVVMVLIAGIVAVSLGATLEDARLRAGARSVVAMCRYARSYAVTHHADTRVVFDIEKRGFSVQIPNTEEGSEGEWRVLTTPAGRFRILPDGVEITGVERADEQEAADQQESVDEENTVITFTALGQAENLNLTLKNKQNKQLIITLDAVTGRCEITDSNHE